MWALNGICTSEFFFVLILTTKSNTDYAKLFGVYYQVHQKLVSSLVVVKRKSFNLARWQMKVALSAMRVDGCKVTGMVNYENRI